MFILNLLATINSGSHNNTDDEIALLKKIKARDANALAELYDLYKRLLFGLLLSITKKREEAESLLQETFLEIWDEAEVFDEEYNNVFIWIITRARSKAITHIRAGDNQSRQEASENNFRPFLMPEGNDPDLFHTTIYSDRSELVKKALQQIPEQQREVIEIAYYRGKTQSEISNYFDIPPEDVKIQAWQGLMELNRILANYLSTNG